MSIQRKDVSRTVTPSESGSRPASRNANSVANAIMVDKFGIAGNRRGKYAERIASNIASLAQQLVSALTSFDVETDEEKYRKSLTFVQRSFSNHQYLESNGNELERSYQALVEKLHVHSMPQSADRLFELSQYLLANDNIHSAFEDGKDTVYNILAMLLQISQSPTSRTMSGRAADYDSCVVTSANEYRESPSPYKLMPTMSDVMSGYDSGSSWSDYQSASDDGGSEDDMSEPQDGTAHPSIVPGATTNDAQRGEDSWPLVPGSDAALHEPRVRGDPFAGIAERLVPPYYQNRNSDAWRKTCEADASLWACPVPGSTDTPTPPLHRADFIHRWAAANELATAPFAHAPQRPPGSATAAPSHGGSQWACVDEAFLVRETCWMLCGLDAWAYPRSSEPGRMGPHATQSIHATPPHATPPHVVVRAGLIGADKTPRALARSLADFAAAGNVVAQLRQFITAVVGAADTTPSLPREGTGSRPDAYGTRTFRAFAVSLAQVLTTFENEVREQEGIAAAAPNTRTGVSMSRLSALSVHLRGSFRQMQSLSAILHRTGVFEPSDCGDAASRVAKLLTVLYEETMMRQNIGESAPGLASVCTKLFVDATRPLCLFLAEWLSRGIHCDPSDEFPVVRVTSIAAEGRNAPQEVWESYALRCNCEDKDAASPLQSTTRPSAKRRANQRDAIGDMHVTTYPFDPQRIPVFLHPLLHDILVTGKSAGIAEMLGEQSHGPIDVHEWLCVAIGVPQYAHEGVALPQNAHDGVARVAMGDREEDELMEQALDAAIVSPVLDTSPPPQKLDPESRQHNANRDVAVTSGALGSFDSLFRDSMHTCCLETGRQLLVVLNNERYRLLQRLRVLRRCYLFEAGSIMHPVCTLLFDVLDNQAEPWGCIGEVSDRLCDALVAAGDGAHASHASLSLPHPLDLVAMETAAPSTAYHCTHDLVRAVRLQLAPTWPLSMVVDGRAMLIYAETFSFLLQLKWATWVLQCGGNGAISGARSVARGVNGVNVHKSFLLRARLSHVVTSVYTYIMTRILHGLEVELREKLLTASDLDELFSIHRWYVHAVHERCLLGEGTRMLLQTVLKVVELCASFRALWRDLDRYLRVPTATRTVGATAADTAAFPVTFARQQPDHRRHEHSASVTPGARSMTGEEHYAQLERDLLKCTGFLSSTLTALVRQGGSTGLRTDDLETLRDELGTYAKLPNIYGP
eukprot:m.992013 g.992013  ORF g.992013 m.992013 type:complete len:1204 (-) comp24004_c0_seq2:159-3770(-)